MSPNGVITSTNGTSSVLINPNGNIDASGTITGTTINSSNLIVNNNTYQNMMKYLYYYSLSPISATTISGTSYTFIDISSGTITFTVNKNCYIDFRTTFHSPSAQGATFIFVLSIDGNPPIQSFITQINESNSHKFRSFIFNFTPTANHRIQISAISLLKNNQFPIIHVDQYDSLSCIIYQIL